MGQSELERIEQRNIALDGEIFQLQNQFNQIQNNINAQSQVLPDQNLEQKRAEERIRLELEKLQLEYRNNLMILKNEQIRINEEDIDERIREKNELDINSLKEKQNISLFLELLEKFYYDKNYLSKIFDAIEENTLIKKFEILINNWKGNIQIIEDILNRNTNIEKSSVKKLALILLCYGKYNNTCNKVFKNLIQKNVDLKLIIFDILLGYSKIFENDIFIENHETYKEFVIFSIEKGKYSEVLDYQTDFNSKLIMLYEQKEKIFESGINIVIKTSQYCSEYFEIIKNLINYEKKVGKIFITFNKQFWDQCYTYYAINEDENNKIKKLNDLFKLLLVYINLGKKDLKYEKILLEKIHILVQNKIEKMAYPKDQIQFLLENDPLYIYNYDRSPEIFQKINILDLQKKEDIEYFKNIPMEKIYLNSFPKYLEIIIKKISVIEDFISIINLTKINKEENREIYINLLFKRYSNFVSEELTEESFIFFLRKIIEYTPNKKIKFLEEFLDKFNQNNTIYLKIQENFKKYNDIQKTIAILSFKNLEIFTLINLIKNIKEEKRSEYFNYLSNSIITYEDFFEIEDSKNLKLLFEIVKNKLVHESIYIDKNKDILYTIYDKLISFDEKKSILSDTLLNEKEDIKKLFLKRFTLFKLIKDEKFDSVSEFNRIRENFIRVKQYIEKSYTIINILSFYYQKTLKEDIEKINNIYKIYSVKDNKVCLWINKEEDIINFIKKYEKKANLIKIIKEIKLFQVIYSDFIKEDDESTKFDKAKELLDGFRTIFIDIEKGRRDILDKWQNMFKKEKGIEEELQKLNDYYKISNKEDLGKIAKKILIFTKKNIYLSDIKCLLYIIKLFESEESELSKILKNNQLEFEKKDNLNMEKLVSINDYLEEKQIYINNGKDDSSLMKFIRLLYNKENEINFIKTKDVDSAIALLYRLNPTTDSLKHKDILEYQSCIDFINDINGKMTDENLLNKIRDKLAKSQINQVFSTFKNYFINYSSIKSLDSNFDSSKDIYENIKCILNNSEFKIEFFKREFKVYDNTDKEKKEIDIIAKDLDGLIQLKDNINLNFEDLPNKVSEKQKKNLNEKRAKIALFVKYVEQIQIINKYFSILENKGCPFLIDAAIVVSNGSINYELVNISLKYNELISLLKEYCNTIVEYQLKFYKEKVYFRYVYDKQLYRLFKRITHKNKDISSYIRFFTNGDSIKDDVPLFESNFNDLSEAYKNYRIAIEEKFELISKYIENLFKINGTSLELLYKNIKVKENYNLKGIYKCNIQKYNMDYFIIKMFLKLTGTFPIAQNILLTNSETSTGEIYSFIYRSIKCEFNTLFVISIIEDFSIQNVNTMTSLMNKIINNMKKENKIESIEDIKPCILFVIQNQNKLGKSKGIIDLPGINDLPEYLKGDENKLDYNLEIENLLANNKNYENEIYNSIKIYTSDCSGLGKSYLIKKDINEKKEDYHYFGIGDDITRDELFKKLKKFLKIEIKGKFDVAIHLDLFYTKNIPLMKYFLFSILITKLYQANNNILYIPKKINIYVEIPNGPQSFLDDFPLLKIFKRINITLDKQIPLDITNERYIKKLLWTNKKINSQINENIIEQENKNTYIENKIYMNIIYYLSSDKEEDKKNYYQKVKNIAKYFSHCVYSQKLRIPDVSKNDKTKKEIEDYILDFQNFKEEDALKIQYDAPLIFKTKNGYIEIDISDKEVKGKNVEYFISNLKNIMSLDESIEEIKNIIGSYKITEDNYKKMILILFRIFANIPVILMGETGCGKTELIKQLMKMLNKDKNNKSNNFIIKNMHSGVKESEIVDIINKAENILNNSKNDLLCIFFDEINTTSLLSKIKEIFVNHSINGTKINERIRFIGACNPFRKKEDNENESGLKFEKINENEDQMTYLVNPLPNSLLYYIFYFKSLEDEDVKKYIESIIGEEFPKGENKDSENSILRNTAIISIYDSHTFIREINGKSSVSLRDLQRFKRAYKFFNEYYKYKNEYLLNNDKKISDKVNIKSKVQSFVLSLFITYYIKIFKPGYNNKYLEKINDYITTLAKEFKIIEWLEDQKWKQQPFTNIVKEEEDFLLEEMEVGKVRGIGLNNSLKENIFLMFFSIYGRLPLIVVGKPGCSKSLSIQLIIRNMRGEFSNSDFLKKYPIINSTGFQGSETNTPESIENIFREAEKKSYSSQSQERILSLLVFDELGLSEKSPTNCLKVLHSKLEMSLDPNEQKQISFIGISNWRLDAAKMNRAIFLAIPDISLNDVDLTVEAIAKSYDENIYNKYKNQYKLLGNAYFFYRDGLKKLNDEFILNFHGGRDLYNLIKNFSSEMLKNNMSDDTNIIEMAVKRSLSRNLSGLEIKGESSLKTYIKDINFDELKIMDLIKDNIKSKDTRFLLLATEKSMFNFLLDILKQGFEQMNIFFSDDKKINYVAYIGSPFKGDRMNISYQTEMIVNIENNIAEGKVIILSELDQIYSIFYDLFNQNYIIKDGKKYCRISHGPNIQKLAFVNENTKFIILVDKNNIRKQKLPFLSRFEKYLINFENLLDEKDREKSKIINNFIKKLISVKDINYNMNNLLVNTNEDIINGYVYLYKNRENNSYKDIIKEKIIPILSQDIIFTLPFSNLDKKEMESFKNDIYSNYKFNSLEEYLKSDKRGKENILIVYTFSNIGLSINLSEKDNYMEIIASQINNVFKFKQLLNEFYENKQYNSLIIKFDNNNSKYINFFISEISHYKEINKIDNNNKKYIFVIGVRREFNQENLDKITTILMADDNVNQLFIDNIDGTELSINDIEEKNIDDYINNKYLNSKKLIIEGMIEFYGENNNEQIGTAKGINSTNFMEKFMNFIENSDELINEIKRIILSKIDNNEKIIDSIIKNKSINQNTVDFITAIINYIKNIFNENLKLFLEKTENNNFYTTIFMLNIKNNEKNDITQGFLNGKLNNYLFNISDEDILKNEIINKIKKEFLKLLKDEKNDKIIDKTINIKLNYKIPGFFNIYKDIKKYLEKEKISFDYKQDETEIRKSVFELLSRSLSKLRNDLKEFNDKLYSELISKQLFDKIIETKITDKSYIEFIELFLNDYITFYLVNLYNNKINDFVINDVFHKIILLLLELKFKGLNNEEKYTIPLQDVISKILWLEGNSKYIKNILELYKLISENIVYDVEVKDILIQNILEYSFKNEIKYEPKESQLVKVNVPYYIIIILLFKCMISKESIKNATSKNDNYYSYFKNLERCLKEMQKLDKLLKLNIKELSILNEFINIYNVYELNGKIDKLDIYQLIMNLTKSLEIIGKNDKDNKINKLFENLKILIKNIRETLYDSSKSKKIKGDKVYYELISKILLDELNRENDIKYKIFILNEFLLEDEKLFIQSNQLLKIILEDFVTSNIDFFQGSLIKLSNPDLEILENKSKNNWISETLIYVFEEISIIYIQNLIDENEKKKKEKQINILLYLKDFFEKCAIFLESTENQENKKKSKNDLEKSNINLKKFFSISFIRVYLKIFIDWIDKRLITKGIEIDEIIQIINGKENNKFRDMIRYYIYKLVYNFNKQDISKLFDQDIIDKYHLEIYSDFKLLKEEKNDPESYKNILFVESYSTGDEDFKIFLEEYNLLDKYLKNGFDEGNELKKLVHKNKRLDIFYSVFSTKISSNLIKTTKDDDQIKKLSNIIHDLFEDKEKLLNIFDLFIDKTKYKKVYINSNIAEILQFSLRYCLNSDEICNEYNNIYYPLYNDEKKINSFLPGNDIKDYPIYDLYSKIKKYLDTNPSYHGVYLCTCNIKEKDKEIYVKFIGGNGYPEKREKCKYCGEVLGNNNYSIFFEKKKIYRIFKNKEDLEEELKKKGNENYITLDDFYRDFIIKKIEKDSKGINITKKSHFDKNDKPMRYQSQIGYRLTNLILYSHLFTNVLFNNKNEIFSIEGVTYLDYIRGNWEKLKKLLDDKGINIYVFMNLIYKDLSIFLNKQNKIEKYNKLLEIENEIENIIDNKISKKTEKHKEQLITKYAKFQRFYETNKNYFREKDSGKKTSLIKEINDDGNPYYKSFLYSDYLDINFFRMKLEEKGKEKYPVLDLYLNGENRRKGIYKNFIIFNFVIKSLLNQYSNKISKEAAKKLTFEKTDIYKLYAKTCDNFIEIINSYNAKKLKKESSLVYFLIDFSTENGKIYKEIYEKYAQIQNDLLNEIIKKINLADYDIFKCQEINIQEAQKEDLIILEFENKSEFLEILLMNTFREIYTSNSNIKYNNYNLFSIDFDKIEKILEDSFIKNTFFLKTDNIIEMKYIGEDFLNDGISEFNKNIKSENLEENDKKEFLGFYEKNLERNLETCLEINDGIKNIIAYVNKNCKKINVDKSISSLINEGGFLYKINDNLKDFFNNHPEITISKLGNLILYLENLYFELSMEGKKEYKEKINDDVKNKIDAYFNNKSGLLITKDKLSLAIIRFLLNIEMNNKNDKRGLVDVHDNLFEYLNNKYLWNNEIFNDNRFTKEFEEYKNLDIKIKNVYDFYSYISNDSKIRFEKEKKEIIEKLRSDEREKALKEKQKKREEEKKIIEKEPERVLHDVDLDDIDDLPDLD